MHPWRAQRRRVNLDARRDDLSRPTARRSNKSDARRLQPRRLSRMHQAQEEAATRWSASRKCEPPGLRESTGGTCGQRPWQFLAQRQDDTNLANDSSVRGLYTANWLSTNILQQERYTETGLDATEKR
jgi:hypothetical protein